MPVPITSFSQLDFDKNYTYADYLTWKFDTFVELIKGKLQRPMAGPARMHQVYFGNIFGEVQRFLKRQPCQVYAAPFDVRLTTAGPNGDADIRTVVQPDICVVCDRAKLDDRGCLGAPDWIVEIVSPGNTDRDVRVKFELYQESGVREYWMVFPGLKNVAAYLLDGEKYRLVAEYTEAGPVPVTTLPGLVLEWEEIFAGD